MTPSNHIKREIGYFLQEVAAMTGITSEVTLDFMERRVTEIVDDAVREAILTTAKVFDGGDQ